MNKITRTEPLEYIEFKNIEIGEPFFQENNTFIKMELSNNSVYNACCLNTGRPYSFPNTVHVTTLTSIVIERESTSIEM